MFGYAVAAGDFNGDGYRDLAVGLPERRGGAVNVIYGSRDGLEPADAEQWTQDSRGVPGVSEPGDYFGQALAVGDFDADGYADVAVGASGENRGGNGQPMGAVSVIYGSSAGLRGPGSQLLTQDTPGIGGIARGGDYFGDALAAGRLGRGRAADLAIGVPGDSLAGGVNVIQGARGVGLVPSDSRRWSPQTAGIKDPERADSFGKALAIGNLGRGRWGDLAVGAPWSKVARTVIPEEGGYSGAVHVIFGSHRGLQAKGNQLWTLDSDGIPGRAEYYEEFGWALAMAHFGDGRPADLAISAPGAAADGAVFVLYGSAQGPTAGTGTRMWTPNTPGVPGSGDGWRGFGRALAAADMGHGPRADLAIGDIDGQDVGDRENVGSVNVLYSRPRGVTAKYAEYWSQDSAGISERAQGGDYFGGALAAGDFGRGPAADLAIGAWGEDLSVGATRLVDAGAVNVIYGNARRGLHRDHDQLWTRNRLR
jgi:hypothetical protein